MHVTVITMPDWGCGIVVEKSCDNPRIRFFQTSFPSLCCNKSAWTFSNSSYSRCPRRQRGALISSPVKKIRICPKLESPSCLSYYSSAPLGCCCCSSLVSDMTEFMSVTPTTVFPCSNLLFQLAHSSLFFYAQVCVPWSKSIKVNPQRDRERQFFWPSVCVCCCCCKWRRSSEYESLIRSLLVSILCSS